MISAYHIAGGNVENGLIAFTGAHNDVVLVVDENDGVFIQNQSEQDVTINGYAILSESFETDNPDLALRHDEHQP